MQRKHLLPLALAALVLLAAVGPAAAGGSKSKGNGGDDEGYRDDDSSAAAGKKDKDRTDYSKPYLHKGADIVGCKHAEVGDDDNAEPVCSDCKGPNFVYNDETELCDCAPGYGTFATQKGTGKPCQRCPKGSYSEGGDAETTECVACPDCTSTSNKKGGATSVDACSVYEPGYGWSGVGDDDDGAGNCAICEVGTWSDGGLKIGNGCYQCPKSVKGLETTTADEGAVTPKACKIEVCEPGYAVNKLGQCKECPKGYTSDGGSVDLGSDQPLCREATDDDAPSADDDEGGKAKAKAPKDGGKGKHYAPEGDDDGAATDGKKKAARGAEAPTDAANKAVAAAAPKHSAATGSRKVDAGAAMANKPAPKA